MTDIREQEMQNRIDSLTLEKENLRYEIDCLKEQIAQLKKMAFGSRTEKTKKILGELEEINLFDEAEVEAKGSAPEPVIEVPAHQRRKKQKGHLEQILKDMPHEERVITLPEDERICERCGTQLTSMGREKIRTEVQFIPATVKVIDFYRESFQCLECRKQEHFSIEKPQMPQPVLAKSIASPSSVAHVIAQKYQFSMPLYRQEQEWKSIGIALSRATLANWVIRSAEDWLMPLVDCMHAELLKQPVIHADETPVQVLNEKGRKNKTKSYMWVYTNGEFVQDGRQIRIYEYHPGRNFQLDPHQPALFLFCGRRKDRIKGLLWDETGFLLLYKRLENGQYQWPDTPEDLLEISEQQLRWLTEGLSISQPKAVQKVSPAYSF